MLSEEVEGAEVGWYVRLHVRGVGTQLYEALQGLVISEFLPKNEAERVYIRFSFLHSLGDYLHNPHESGKSS